MRRRARQALADEQHRQDDYETYAAIRDEERQEALERDMERARELIRMTIGHLTAEEQKPRPNQMPKEQVRQIVSRLFDTADRVEDPTDARYLKDMAFRIMELAQQRPEATRNETGFQFTPDGAHVIYRLYAAPPEQLRGIADALHEQPISPDDASSVAPVAEETIENALARLFIRLGPPPETTELDYTPAGHGGGGATQ
ncbi:hypothetical protein GCM10018777_08110 [Streptomyces albogriseolus]|uniref:hypothetical protein n=1 Tax=Streptomyces TaxID=1883 RepID=UPI00131A420C|nr:MULTISPECIES: hypothetical protein [Streptomyces]GHF99958.1 hypothetical protein GCM10018777_08110 [Streptomyces viridodiastaticus]